MLCSDKQPGPEWLMQEAVVDSLGICTVLEGCRQLTKIAFNQLDMADSVFERMARQTTQLQVWSLVCRVFWSLLASGYRGLAIWCSAGRGDPFVCRVCLGLTALAILCYWDNIGLAALPCKPTLSNGEHWYETWSISCQWNGISEEDVCSIRIVYCLFVGKACVDAPVLVSD